MKRTSMKLLLAFIPALGLHDACAPHSSPPSPELLTDGVVTIMRTVVDSFTRLEGRRPVSFDEACSRLTPSYGPHPRPPHCGYWLHGGDTIPLDGWRDPLLYHANGNLVSIRSAGADGRFGTPDDMGFSTEEERERVAAAAGCYRVDFRDWKEFPGDVMRLDTTYHAGGTYRAAPVIAPYFAPLWQPSPYPSGRDSVYVVWQAIHHGVHFHFRVYPDSMTGFVFGGPYRRPRVVVRRIPCPG
jgi:hypothetical protein